MGKKINIGTMIKSAEAALGWPYVTPGTNNAKGIDCSGLFVRMWADQGAKIAHGSNSIFHQYCSATGKIEKSGQLRAGMAVFKILKWTDADKGNKWYGKEPGNLSHIGVVVSVSPLKIIHASSAAGCVTTDTKIGKWAYWGLLKDVDYPEKETAGGNTPAPEGGKTMGKVKADTSIVKMRKTASASETTWWKIPTGNSFNVLETGITKDGKDWVKGIALDEDGKSRTGYMMAEFVDMSGEPETTPGGDAATGEGNVTVIILTSYGKAAIALPAALAQVLLPKLESAVNQLVDQIGRG